MHLAMMPEHRAWTHLGGAHDAHGEAPLAGQQQRLVHLVKGLVEGLHAGHALVARQVAPAAAGVQEPLALVAVVLVPVGSEPGSGLGSVLGLAPQLVLAVASVRNAHGRSRSSW